MLFFSTINNMQLNWNLYLFVYIFYIFVYTSLCCCTIVNHSAVIRFFIYYHSRYLLFFFKTASLPVNQTICCDIETNPGVPNNSNHNLSLCHWNLRIATNTFIKYSLFGAYSAIYDFDIIYLIGLNFVGQILFYKCHRK